jgi:polyhydroxyalkanoate synthesis regulator phasin
MAETDVIKRLLDAGVNFTEMTQQRAEALVEDLVQSGAVRAEQAGKAVDQLLARSSESRQKLRQESEALIESIRQDIEQQVARLGVATKDDVASLRRRVDTVADALTDVAARAEAAVQRAAAKAGGPGSKKAAKKATAKKKAAKKATAKKKATVKKKAAKKAAATKASKKARA